MDFANEIRQYFMAFRKAHDSPSIKNKTSIILLLSIKIILLLRALKTLFFITK